MREELVDALHSIVGNFTAHISSGYGAVAGEVETASIDLRLLKGIPGMIEALNSWKCGACGGTGLF